ncbi:tigger transposable element-derived protein 6-like [Zootermopsis nevadensis]|uniref:tigger transposable element-derived protein 6-like n=1 Tax=Zootermopsis nevadensis TaxID=136037 RepID=UPI000B8E9402|nr:tigger transposable element-derived protein 6-like [Zootermopsis nevadensis]
MKKLPVKYHANKKAWMTTDIFTAFLSSLDASMGAQGRKILLFVDNCAAHPKDTTFLRNVKVVQYPANCTSVLQPLDLGIIKSFKQLYRKRLMQTAVCALDAGKDVNMKIDVLQAIHFTVAAWRHVSQPTVLNCFHKGGYGCELRTEADSNVSVDEHDGFHEDWNRFGAVKDVVKFGDYAAVDSELAKYMRSRHD